MAMIAAANATRIEIERFDMSVAGVVYRFDRSTILLIELNLELTRLCRDLHRRVNSKYYRNTRQK